MQTEIFEYPLTKYNFTEIISSYLNTDDLSKLKAEPLENSSHPLEGSSIYKNMEETKTYKQLYEILNSERGKVFYETYEKFIKEIIRPQYDEPIYYQAKPTNRILYKNSPGQSRFHKDKQYGHHEAEINYMVPQTEATGTNSLWIESQENKKDFTALNMSPGEFARFKGVDLMHGAKVNSENKTRVSFDFRVIPESQWPGDPVDTTNWKQKDKENFLFKNAHNFAYCP